MQTEKFDMFRNRLAKVARHLGKQAKRQGVTCYRLYDHDLPEFPFCIEFYGEKLYVAEYQRRHGMTDEAHEAWMSGSLAVIRETLGVAPEDIFLKRRQKKNGRQGQYQKLDHTAQETVVEENGLKFLVNLSDYLDTGLFLDHRETRAMVRSDAENKRVLNLFCYTGSFSVYAAAGGATEVVSVDLSATYLDWARRNMALNGFDDPVRYHFSRSDVRTYLASAPRDHFDLIILDPPTFSNSKRTEGFLEIQRDHVGLINECIDVLKTGGLLYFSTNYRKFVIDEQLIRSTRIRNITQRTTPFDFEGRLERYCFQITK